MFVFDFKIANSVVADVFGDESVKLSERPQRPPTTVELHLVAELARRIAGALEAAFDGLSPSSCASKGSRRWSTSMRWDGATVRRSRRA